MKFKIPFTASQTTVLAKRSKPFQKWVRRKDPKLEGYLKDSNQKITGTEYKSICFRGLVMGLAILIPLATFLLLLLGSGIAFLLGPGIGGLFALFMFFLQRNYPKVYASQKAKDLEKNLITVLQDMLVQLNSGVPLFKIMYNIAHSEYGEVSDEFKKIVAEINSGVPQLEAIEKYGKQNSSEYFRRVLWQIGNGMRAGSDMAIILKEEIKNLSDEQAVQIQTYGSTLNPLIMFYMLIAVIIPSLGITFLIIISSMVGVPSEVIEVIMIFAFIGILFVQMMFMGIIKSKRPSLL